ncbi:MAG: cysteine hydrolase [Peptoniphilaceae bacterium]|uniref:isochorismatase family cysteine hydrolase n=1 Tax=Parvimonas sp. TaxID=1944660 RepID=UPI0025FA0E8D|nr:isochorismatase family cysteine hydrolase [Parvimonas sp.]MCI5996939.1 cysteine hydrolase [Parvimonas sp.]MDD7765025.1 cysteine hydrolase [Peptoniphilaceae bacterium]MDY3050291.1 isochorismatase family cysteine hydrolase [Parvimonas sp.]
MKALLVLDLQKGIISQKNFDNTLANIKILIDDFKKNNDIVILTKHISKFEENPLYIHGKGVEIEDDFVKLADYVIEKDSCNPFLNTDLYNILLKNNITDIYICGFNTEYCCLFSSIISTDRGFKTVFIEDATDTIGDEDIYEMPGLDIRDFIGSILNWSELVEVLYVYEYLELRDCNE